MAAAPIDLSGGLLEKHPPQQGGVDLSSGMVPAGDALPNPDLQIIPTSESEPGFIGHVKTAVHNFGATTANDLIGMGHAVAHPLDTLSALSDLIPGSPDAPELPMKLPSGKVMLPSDRPNPIVSAGQDFAHTAVSDPSLALESLAGHAATGLITGAAGKAIAGVPAAVMGSPEGAAGVVNPGLLRQVGLRAPITSLSPIEKSAVDITKAVGPPHAAMNNYLKATENQTGNIIDYAQRNGIPINDARDFAKAAEGAAKETLAHYQDNFLNPNADQPVPIKDTGYRGTTNSDGTMAKLGDVNTRIDQINRELKSNFRKPTEGQVSSAGASDAELEAERANLADVLHRSLANLTGTQPENIAALRVRGGELKTIAGETKGAANAVSGAGGADASGVQKIPTGIGDLAKEAVSFVRGGTEKVAAGKLRQALRASPMVPTPLLEADAESIAARQAAAEANRQAAQSEFLHTNNLEQAAQDAAAGRNAQTQPIRSQPVPNRRSR